MPFMNWTEDYSVGVDHIDNQHQQFFTFINTLHQAFHDGRGEEELRQTIEELCDYAAFHFQSEEDLLRSIAYHMTLNHEDEHKKFSAQAQEFRRKYQSGNFAITVPVMDFMKKWLSRHILDSDKKYARFIQDNNITIENRGDRHVHY